MQSTTQDLASKKRMNVATAPLSKTSSNDLAKPNDLTPVKDNSLERLLDSCCDCV